MPFYLTLNSIPSNPESRAVFLDACAALKPSVAEMLLTERDWRGRNTVAWMIGINQWDQFVPQMARQLIASELVNAGQGYCVGLTLIANPQAQQALVDYLDRWLPEHDCHYDQHWAMGALIEVDRVRDTNEAERFLAPGGPWDSWLEAQRSWNIDSPVAVGEIVALLRKN